MVLTVIVTLLHKKVVIQNGNHLPKFEIGSLMWARSVFVTRLSREIV